MDPTADTKEKESGASSEEVSVHAQPTPAEIVRRWTAASNQVLMLLIMAMMSAGQQSVSNNVKQGAEPCLQGDEETDRSMSCSSDVAVLRSYRATSSFHRSCASEIQPNSSSRRWFVQSPRTCKIWCCSGGRGLRRGPSLPTSCECCALTGDCVHRAQPPHLRQQWIHSRSEHQRRAGRRGGSRRGCSHDSGSSSSSISSR